MEKPEVNIIGLTFDERRSFPSGQMIQIANVTYTQSDVSYPLITTGEGDTHIEALQDAIKTLNWAVALDTTFTAQEISLIQTAHDLYIKEGTTTWYTDKTLADLAGIQINPSVESNVVRTLAAERVFLRHDGFRTIFRLSDFGKYIAELHAQFNPKDDA